MILYATGSSKPSFTGPRTPQERLSGGGHGLVRCNRQSREGWQAMNYVESSPDLPLLQQLEPWSVRLFLWFALSLKGRHPSAKIGDIVVSD